MEKAEKTVSGKVFENGTLEALTKSSPALIIGMYIPVILGLLFYDAYYNGRPVVQVLGIFAAGIAFWTLAEYFLHRYVFHWERDHPFVKKFHYYAHGFHHTYPRDQDHLFMPPVASIVLAAFFYGLFWLISHTYVVSFFPGFILGYLGYASMHYAIHTVPNPPKFLRPIWRHHQLHHSKNTDSAYGVSTPFWDHVFRTLP